MVSESTPWAAGAVVGTAKYGDLVFRGVNCKKDIVHGSTLLSIAAEHGLDFTALKLGQAYDQGKIKMTRLEAIDRMRFSTLCRRLYSPASTLGKQHEHCLVVFIQGIPTLRYGCGDIIRYHQIGSATAYWITLP